MKFFYTGAAQYLAEQKFSFLSLGGFISSTEIPNDFINNIFSDVSEFSKQNLNRETVLIVLKNEDEELAYNIKLKFNIADFSKMICDFEIAFVHPLKNNCNEYFFEKINDLSARPYLTFDKITSTNNEFLLGNLDPNKYIGVWLSRKPIKDKVKPLSCDQLSDNFINDVELDIEESFSVDLTWNEDESNSNSASL